MSKLIDRTGQRFSRLVVESRAKNDKSGNTMWHCLCDCGGMTVVRGGDLTSGNTTSCECYQREQRITHGDCTTKLYVRWGTMIQRTENPNGAAYHNYGGRGITVCERWKSFENFRDDMSATFDSKLSLERRDNDVGYSPENCYWATRKEQQRNRRNNRILEHNGKSLLMVEWADKLGIEYDTIFMRLSRGWSVPEALGFVARSRNSA